MNFSPSASNLTPLMQQYFDLRAQYQDALLLFQVGDFYELFFDDAQTVAAFLGIALTKRGTLDGKPIPLCGFPVHVLDHYVTKLVKGGFKVALCQQLQEAIPGKMVSRGVTQVFTPGTLTSESLLDAKSASYLFAFVPMQKSWGLIFSELMTSQLHATILPVDADKSLETELFRFLPDEIVLKSNGIQVAKFDDFFKQRGFFTTRYGLAENEEYLEQIAAWSQVQFSRESYEQLQRNEVLVHTLALWHGYLSKNQKDAVNQFKEINFYKPEEFLQLDAATQKNLDIVHNSVDGSKKYSLFASVDRAITPMGSRMIKRWLLRPLMDIELIYSREQVVAYLVINPMILQSLHKILEQFGDLQRIVGRIALQKASMKDYVHLGKIAGIIPQLHEILQQCPVLLVQDLLSCFIDLKQLHELVTRACNDDDQHDWQIKKGYDSHLDFLRDCIAQTDQKLLDLEVAEQQRTGITTLKIRQNNVHGFYIEVTKANADLVPSEYIRQQTLVGRERYTMPILQQMQAQATQAQLTITQYEKELFVDVKEKVSVYIGSLRKIAEAIATIDALVGFATLAYESSYVCPQFNQNRDIVIRDGKHPVIGQQLQHNFIANDTQLSDEQSLWIVTGPNMGGKSTYLRQVALICILAQAGSFVPASAANLPILDRIFTRIGAGDNLAEGKSTFLIEMEETAQICLQATKNSLVILDEVGRGTSTFDGLALAQAVVEYIYQQVQARCLFATHYHELTHLQDQHAGIVNYYADSKKTEHGILFLHKIIKGTARQSFGLEVAKLAKLPHKILIRAHDLLHQFEQKDQKQGQLSFLPVGQVVTSEQNDYKQRCVQLEQQIALQQKILLELANIDCNTISPKQAFDILWRLQEQLK
ncbi:MAG: DNA mismatch repair protein MutS [Candidatus Chromulinivorax sp.]